MPVYWIFSVVGSVVGSVVEWLKRRARDQNGLGSKPTRAILLYPWERHFTALSPCSVFKNRPHYVYSQSHKKSL